tara:strand:+ start:677 stop:2863 length:2187 start_codon:yes stop_codon:yes gene_type:complete
MFLASKLKALLPSLTVASNSDHQESWRRSSKPTLPLIIKDDVLVHNREGNPQTKTPGIFAHAYKKIKATFAQNRCKHECPTMRASVQETSPSKAPPVPSSLARYGLAQITVILDSPSVLPFHMATARVLAPSEHGSAANAAAETTRSSFIKEKAIGVSDRLHTNHRDEISECTFENKQDTFRDCGIGHTVTRHYNTSVRSKESIISDARDDVELDDANNSVGSGKSHLAKDLKEEALNDHSHGDDLSTEEVGSQSCEDGDCSDTTSHISSVTSQAGLSLNEEEELTRADWEPLTAIEHTKFHRILAQHIEGASECQESDFEFVNEVKAGYNYVRLYTLRTGHNAGTYVVKVPSVGTSRRWKKQDAYMLRSEVGTINLIREHTKCPVPEIVASEDTLTNPLGAPFIIMRACSGVNAGDIWFDRMYNGDDDVENPHFPSAERYAKREVFLESLARAMAGLRTLEFDKVGVLNFENVDCAGRPSIGPCWHWRIDPNTVAEDLNTEAVLREQPVSESSADIFVSGLRKKWPYNPLEGGRVMAIHHILDALYRTEPFAHSSTLHERAESFVLRHDDLDFQNFFCDPHTGEVTCIIDWERCSTAPRCIGYSSLPIFLTMDWYPDYDITYSPWSLESYRNIYAKAMLQATGKDGDGRYTTKSALYQAAYAALYGSPAGGSISHFVRQVLRDMPGLHRLDQDQFLDWLAENWAVYGERIRNQISQLVAPDNFIDSS